MSKIKVLEIVPNMQQGGLENLIMNIIRNIDFTKYEVHFLYHYTSDFYFDNEIIELGCIIHKCSFREDNNIFKYIKYLKTLFSTYKFDVVHSHMLSTSRITLKYAKKYGCPKLINHAHNSTTEKSIKGLLKKIMISCSSKYANIFLACSEEAGNFAYKGKQFTVINNCIDINKFKYNLKNRNSIRKKLSIKEDEIVYGNIGRLNIQKNQKFLIDSFAKNNNLKTKLVIIGSGELKKELIDRIDELGISDRVIMLENVKSELYYSAFDYFVLASLFEGFPLTAVEAQANGCPCIFSNKITNSVKLNNNVSFLDIDSIDEWAKYFENNNLKRVDKLNVKLNDFDKNNLIDIIDKMYAKE